MIYRIGVWQRSTGDQQPAGEMVCEINDSGRARGAFRYDPTYLEAERAFPLDPVSLPLQGGSFAVDHPGVFGVFEDSLPDDWGRRLLVRRNRIPRHEQNLPNLLLALGASGLGALSYAEQDDPQPPSEYLSIHHLSALLEAARMFELGETKDAELSILFAAGSSPGGARPKAVVFDEENAIHYLAKFPSVKDQEDIVRIEAATMSLAARAGLVVPDTRLVHLAGGKSTLLVRRFDVIPNGRRHMVSFQTLLKAQGYYQLRYHDLLAVLRKYSSDPLVDSERFYRQMVFNAVVGNTDDHLKNFLMLHDHENGWRLSPAFDLIPDVGRRGEHVLFFDLGAYCPGRRKLEKIGRTWGISNAESVVAEVYAAVAAWQKEFAATGLSGEEILRFRDIDTRLAE